MGAREDQDRFPLSAPRFSEGGRAQRPDALSEAIRSAGERQSHPAGATLDDDGGAIEVAYLVEDGWLVRTRIVGDGGSAISALYLAGDIINLDGLTETHARADLCALSAASVICLPIGELRGLVEARPELCFDVFRRMTADSDWLREALMAVGQLNAADRLVTLAYQTYRRLLANGEIGVRPDSFELPMTQAQLAEMAGITNIHVSRTLKELREHGVLHLASRQARVLDWDEFERRALKVLR